MRERSTWRKQRQRRPKRDRSRAPRNKNSNNSSRQEVRRLKAEVQRNSSRQVRTCTHELVIRQLAPPSAPRPAHRPFNPLLPVRAPSAFLPFLPFPPVQPFLSLPPSEGRPSASSLRKE